MDINMAYCVIGKGDPYIAFAIKVLIPSSILISGYTLAILILNVTGEFFIDTAL